MTKAGTTLAEQVADMIHDASRYKVSHITQHEAYGLANKIIALVIEEAAKVVDAEYQTCLAHPTGHGAGTANRIAVAIRKLGDPL